jgi:hypothetical protein
MNSRLLIAAPKVQDKALYRHNLAQWKLVHITSVQQVRQLRDVCRDAPGLSAGALGLHQRLPAHGEKVLAYKAEQRLGTGKR